jgi:hypothetical protein
MAVDRVALDRVEFSVYVRLNLPKHAGALGAIR